MDAKKALRYVNERGSEIEKARAFRAISGGKAPVAVEGEISRLQNADGGFPLYQEKGGSSTLDSTLFVFGWLDQLGLIPSPLCARSCQFLLERQESDGGWDERSLPPPLELPPWSMPGDLKARLYLSAHALFWLEAAGLNERPIPLRRAISFILSHQEENGKFYGYLHTTWIGSSALLLAGTDFLAPARLGLDYLLKREPELWEASQMAWALSSFARAGLPGNHPLIEKLLRALMEKQRPDGSWASEDGDAYAAEATVSALWGFRLYGLIL